MKNKATENWDRDYDMIRGDYGYSGLKSGIVFTVTLVVLIVLFCVVWL